MASDTASSIEFAPITSGQTIEETDTFDPFQSLLSYPLTNQPTVHATANNSPQTGQIRSYSVHRTWAFFISGITSFQNICSASSELKYTCDINKNGASEREELSTVPAVNLWTFIAQQISILMNSQDHSQGIGIPTWDPIFIHGSRPDQNQVWVTESINSKLSCFLLIRFHKKNEIAYSIRITLLPSHNAANPLDAIQRIEIVANDQVLYIFKRHPVQGIEPLSQINLSPPPYLPPGGGGLPANMTPLMMQTSHALNPSPDF